jgi:hypothetical protein
MAAIVAMIEAAAPGSLNHRSAPTSARLVPVARLASGLLSGRSEHELAGKTGRISRK